MGVDAEGGRRTQESGHADWDTGRELGHAGRHVWAVTGTHWVASRMPHTHVLVGVSSATGVVWYRYYFKYEIVEAMN